MTLEERQKITQTFALIETLFIDKLIAIENLTNRIEKLEKKLEEAHVTER